MLDIRRDKEIHREEGGWFSARWHFSFGSYRDPRYPDGLGPLRVFNDDRLVPGAVWPMHPHKDIEGITYVVEGTFEHADSLGNGGRLQPGAVQRMTLGSGAEHSERNGSATEPMRFLQLWLLPNEADLPPSVEQLQFTRDDRMNQLLRVLGPPTARPNGHETVKVHQDASMWIAYLEPGIEVEHHVGAGRGVYAYLIEGAVRFSGDDATSGDVAVVVDEPGLEITATSESELLLVDVPVESEPVGIWAR